MRHHRNPEASHPASSVFRRCVGGAILAFGVASAAEAANGPTRSIDNGRQMYQGASMTCLIANDFYAMHFTALQKGRQHNEATEFAKYCQEVPSVGETFLTVDLLDRDVRKLPVALRVVEESYSADGAPPKEVRTLVETPRQVYKNGTAETHVDIPQPGHYALIVSVGEDPFSEDDHVRIPFSVALPAPAQTGSWLGKLTWTAVAIFFGIMGIIGFRTLTAPVPKRTEAQAPASARKLPAA
ncbi:hypothetical protein EWI61_05690 [Methylolobus aquaticus]|nr:hypothetical protein EWI61_05690 [Methylolobus aquaticus]